MTTQRTTLSPHQILGAQRLVIVLAAFATWAICGAMIVLAFLGMTMVGVLLAAMVIISALPVLGLISRTWLRPWRDQPAA